MATQGNGGNVDIALSGSILSPGLNSAGVLAQSIGLLGAGSISVTINSGTVQGGTGTGAGVVFMDGANNTLENHGFIVTVDGTLESPLVPGLLLRIADLFE